MDPTQNMERPDERPVVVGTCKCGGYGVVYDEETEADVGRCHDPLEDTAVELAPGMPEEELDELRRYSEQAHYFHGAVQGLNIGAWPRQWYSSVGPSELAVFCEMTEGGLDVEIGRIERDRVLDSEDLIAWLTALHVEDAALQVDEDL